MKVLLGDLTIEEVIAELKRESTMRKTVYPRLIASGKVTEANAIKQTLRLNAAIKVLVSLKEYLSSQKSLFHEG